MKYIPADKLIAEIERRKTILDKYKDSFETAACCKQELEWMEDFISSLQQEQTEVDLEKDIRTFTAEKLLLPIIGKQSEPMDITEGDWVACAHHFYELGLNSRKS